MNHLEYYFEIFSYLPIFYQLFLSALFGLIVGSFLNVVILRQGTKENLQGRSHCVQCQYNLRWYDLIPVISWLILRGKCRKCQQKISIQYPLVELLTAVLFTFIYFHLTKTSLSPIALCLVFLWHAVIFSLLIVMAVFDLKHKIIPNAWSYSFAILAFMQTLWILSPDKFWSQGLTVEMSLNLLAGVIFFIPFFCLWYFSNGKWIGLGDGKLVVGIGWYLGFVGGLSAIILAFWIGGAIAVTLLLIDRLNKRSGSITMKTEIPFGPFLIFGTIVHFFWTLDMIGISSFFL